MRFNSAKSITAAEKVFKAYDGSWTAAREAGRRNADGVLVIPRNPPREKAPVEGRPARGRAAE